MRAYIFSFGLLLILVSIVSLIVSFVGLFSREPYQEFGFTDDDFGLYAMISIGGFVIWYFTSREQIPFWKAINKNVEWIFCVSLFMFFSVLSLFENLNWYFTKTPVTQQCKILGNKYIEEPISPSEDDYHHYPYYEIFVEMDGQQEKFDCSTRQIALLQEQKAKSINLNYKVGILGTKYLLSPIGQLK